MTFLNPFFLFGLAAASLPVLFHLFARRRSRRVEFSSLRFLQKLEKTSMRAVKLRQILLLIIRTLLIACLVLAFARPALKGYLGSFFGSSHANTSMVFLIDNSASMSRSDESGELLKQSKDGAASIASLLTDGDDATVIPIASIGRGATFSPMHKKGEVLAAINDVRIVDRPATLADGLRMASSVLASSQNVNKEVYILSDNQARNLSESEEGRAVNATDSNHVSKLFDPATKVFTMAVGHGEKLTGRNLALDSLRPVTTIFEPGRPVQFEAWVRNTTNESAQNAIISLFYNDERVAQKTIPAIAGMESQHIVIDGPARGSGVIGIHAQLEQDALPFDNDRYTVITIPLSRRIGIFMENPADATFLTLALEQTLTQTQGALPFIIEIKPADELRSLPALASHYDAVVLGLGPHTLDPSDLSGLKEYLSGGHGASIFLMPGLDITATNRELGSLGLPWIAQKQGAPNETTHYLSFAQLEFSHPFFSGMFEQTPSNGSLRGIQSPKIFESYDLASGVGIPLIKLSNGSPFLVETKIGKGDALLFAVPPTMAYSDLPRKSIFLPLIRRAAAYTSSVRTTSDESLNAHYVTTEPLDIPLPESVGEQPGSTVLVKAPDGSSSRAQIVAGADDKPHLHVDEAKVAGNYWVYKDAEAQEPLTAFAVNIQSDESDLRAASSAEMKKYLSARMSGPKPSIISLANNDRELAKTVEQSRYGVELWQSFLWAALVLAILELIIAREGVQAGNLATSAAAS